MHHIPGWETRTCPADMIPDKAPKEDVFHGSEELKKEAHISSFEQYKEMYLRSIESPDGEGSLSLSLCLSYTHTHTPYEAARNIKVFSALLSGSQWF